MRLFEFAQDDPLRVKLTAVASQLESRFKNQNQPLPLDFFLDILRKSDIAVDEEDIYDIINSKESKKQDISFTIMVIEYESILFAVQIDRFIESIKPEEEEEKSDSTISNQQESICIRAI
jgi:hypothetical protein